MWAYTSSGRMDAVMDMARPFGPVAPSICSCCDQHHDGLPFGYGAPAPDYWHEDLEAGPTAFSARSGA